MRKKAEPSQKEKDAKGGIKGGFDWHHVNETTARYHSGVMGVDSRQISNVQRQLYCSLLHPYALEVQDVRVPSGLSFLNKTSLVKLVQLLNRPERLVLDAIHGSRASG
jgi:hypothetical protein